MPSPTSPRFAFHGKSSIFLAATALLVAAQPSTLTSGWYSRRKRPGNSPGARASGPGAGPLYERASRVNQLDVSIRCLQREMRSHAVGGDRDPPRTMVDRFLDRRGPSTPTPRSRSTTCGLWMMSSRQRDRSSLDRRVSMRFWVADAV